MKKLLILILCPLLLCSCSQTPQGYIVTSIAVDYNSGLYVLWYETIITNSEKAEQKREILGVTARTFDEASKKIKKQATLPFVLSHCQTVIIGDGITRTKLKGIMRYCKENPDVTLSVQFLRCANPQKLIENKPISSISVGYDLASFSKTQNRGFKNRLFEIKRMYEKYELWN